MNAGLQESSVAEFFGTLILVVVAVGVATESFGFKLFGSASPPAVAATALAFGLVLVALVYAIGPISGCHVNPAVTLGFIASGRMKLAEGVAYIVAQVIGAIAGAYLLYWMFTRRPLLQEADQVWAPTATARRRTCTSARGAPSSSRWC